MKNDSFCQSFWLFWASNQWRVLLEAQPLVVFVHGAELWPGRGEMWPDRVGMPGMPGLEPTKNGGFLEWENGGNHKTWQNMQGYSRDRAKKIGSNLTQNIGNVWSQTIQRRRVYMSSIHTQMGYCIQRYSKYKQLHWSSTGRPKFALKNAIKSPSKRKCLGKPVDSASSNSVPKISLQHLLIL